jgi:hypothetical protein
MADEKPWKDAQHEKPSHHDPVLGLWAPPHSGYRLAVVRWDEDLNRWQIARDVGPALAELRIEWWQQLSPLPAGAKLDMF